MCRCRPLFLALLAVGVLLLAEGLAIWFWPAPDEDWTATVSGDAGHTPREFRRLGVTGYVNGVAWNADGSRLAALSNFGSVITVWDAKTGKRLNKIHCYSGGESGNAFAFLADGTLAVPAAGWGIEDGRKVADEAYTLTLYDPDSGAVVRNVRGPRANNFLWTFAVSPDGTQLAAAPVRDRTHAVIYNTRDWSIARTLTVPPPDAVRLDTPMSFAFSPDSTKLAVGSLGGVVYLYNLGDGSIETRFIPCPECSIANRGVGTLAFRPDGHVLASGNSGTDSDADRGATRIHRMADHTTAAVFFSGTNIHRDVTWSRDGQTFAAVNGRGLWIWRFAGEPREQPPVLVLPVRAAMRVAISPSGVIAVPDNNEIVLIR